eukprot:6230109-Heterocapsa_arctica.AAC.1
MDRLLRLEPAAIQDGVFGPQMIKCFNECGPLLGEEQGSDRAEVRALVAVLEKTEDAIQVITDNQYVRDTAQYLAARGMAHK